MDFTLTPTQQKYRDAARGFAETRLAPDYQAREQRGFIEKEIRHELGRLGLIVVPQAFRGFDYPAMVERLRPGWPELQHVLVVDGQTGDGGTTWEEFIATPWEERRDPAELASLRPDPNDVTLLIFTSGTTGEPKGVMHTHNTLVRRERTPRRASRGQRRQRDPHGLHIRSPDRFPVRRTPAHAARRRRCLSGRLEGRPVRDARREAPDQLHIGGDAVPVRPAQREHLAHHNVSSLERFCCMGAPIPRAIVREAREKLPTLAVLGGWGQSEDALVTLGVPGDPEEKIVERDGLPWPGMRIRVVDALGNVLPPRQEGRLQVVGPFLFVGYYERLEMTRQFFTDEWFDTGDLAWIDEEGYLSISGRTKDVIIRGGENIPVAYVENALHENPKLESVAVVGLPDLRLQERACAVVTLKPGAEAFTFQEMQQFLGEKGVAKQYWPERLEVVPELPRTASGKIQKFQIRARILEQS